MTDDTDPTPLSNPNPLTAAGFENVAAAAQHDTRQAERPMADNGASVMTNDPTADPTDPTDREDELLVDVLGADASTAAWGDSDGIDAQLGVASDSMTTMVTPARGIDRNVSLETLWFRLADPEFVVTALVPIPEVTGEQATQFGMRLAQVGASITGRSVQLVDAQRLAPADAQRAVRRVSEGGATPMLVVVDSPTFDTAAIPVLRACDRTVLLVGLGDTTSEGVAEVMTIIGADQVAGSVCIERQPPRRLWRRRPGRSRRSRRS